MVHSTENIVQGNDDIREVSALYTNKNLSHNLMAYNNYSLFCVIFYWKKTKCFDSYSYNTIIFYGTNVKLLIGHGSLDPVFYASNVKSMPMEW